MALGLIAIVVNGCCTRHFVVQSDPEKAMVIMGSHPNHFGLADEICGEAPVNRTITFMGKNHTCHFTALKRGYEADTVTVNRDSELTVNLRLKKTSNYTADLLDADDDMSQAKFYMLPVHVDVILHKGVGNLDKYERSDKLSHEVYDSLDMRLKNTTVPEQLQVISHDHFMDPRGWKAMSDSLKQYLLTLNTQLLPYYPVPPAIQGPALNLAKNAVNQTCQQKQADTARQILVYVWCKSIEPTTGRVIGNMAANAGSGVVQGYEMATYGHTVTVIDPGAFALDNHTLWMIFPIDMQSGRIIQIQQHNLPFAITKPKYINEFATILMNVPELINSPGKEK